MSVSGPLGENPQPLDATAAIGISYGALFAAVEVDVFCSSDDSPHGARSKTLAVTLWVFGFFFFDRSQEH